MKKAFIFLVFSLAVIACNNIEKEISERSIPQSIDRVSINESQDNIYIKDKSLYDKTFLKGLSDYEEKVKIIDNILIIGNDTTYFPEDIPLNRKIVFKGSKNNTEYILEVKRTNFTNIDYTIHLKGSKGEIVDSRSGKAVLGSMFFLASEMDEDTETGDGYGSYEYWDNSNNCHLAIRIGIGKDENGKSRAMMTYACGDKSRKSLDLDQGPTLRTE